MSYMPSGMPAGPAGCRAAGIVLVLVALAMIAFVDAVWWLLRDMRQFYRLTMSRLIRIPYRHRAGSPLR